MSDQIIATAEKIAKDIAMQRDAQLMKQLNWLLSRGLLTVRTSGGKMLWRDLTSGQLSYAEEIELVLKDAEYIEKLEAENKELKAFRDRIGSIVNHPAEMPSDAGCINKELQELKGYKYYKP